MFFSFQFTDLLTGEECSYFDASDLLYAVLFFLGYSTFRTLSVGFESPSMQLSGNNQAWEVQNIDRDIGDIAFLKQSDLQPDDSQALQDFREEMLMEKQLELQHELALELEDDIDLQLSLQLASKQLSL